MFRTDAGGNQQVHESVYSGPADIGSNFRVHNCHYEYNLSASALGVEMYQADILISGQVIGNVSFALR